MIHKRSTALERSVKILLEDLSQFHGANLALNSDGPGHISERDKTQENTTYMTADRSALSQQVPTRLQETTRQHNTHHYEA